MVKILWLIGCVALLAIIAWADAASGYEISLYALYTVPVAFAAWKVGKRGGVALAVLGAAAMAWADKVDHLPTRAAWIPWELALSRGVIFTFIALSFDHFRRSELRDHARLRDLETVLPMCRVCHRVKNEAGEWVEFEVQLEHLGKEPERRLCADCAKVKYVSELAP